MTMLVALLLISIFTVDYLVVELELVSRYVIIVPEVFSLLIGLLIVGRSVALRRWEQPVRYVWLLVAFILVCLMGVVAQVVEPGALVSGLRN